MGPPPLDTYRLVFDVVNPAIEDCRLTGQGRHISGVGGIELGRGQRRQGDCSGRRSLKHSLYKTLAWKEEKLVKGAPGVFVTFCPTR